MLVPEEYEKYLDIPFDQLGRWHGEPPKDRPDKAYARWFQYHSDNVALVIGRARLQEHAYTHMKPSAGRSAQDTRIRAAERLAECSSLDTTPRVALLAEEMLEALR